MAFPFERVELYGRTMDSAVVTVHLERRGTPHITHCHAELDGITFSMERLGPSYSWPLTMAAYEVIWRLLEREGRPLGKWHPAIIDTTVDLANNRASVRFVIYGPDTEPARLTASGSEAPGRRE
jgi:hypothetical protein